MTVKTFRFAKQLASRKFNDCSRIAVELYNTRMTFGAITQFNKLNKMKCILRFENTLEIIVWTRVLVPSIPLVKALKPYKFASYKTEILFPDTI